LVGIQAALAGPPKMPVTLTTTTANTRKRHDIGTRVIFIRLLL
jgi:hypothetical protein